ncbi:hypothetical protein CG422_26940, partial [Shigella flexneri]
RSRPIISTPSCPIHSRASQFYTVPCWAAAEVQRPGAQSTDYFHAILSYPQPGESILHGTMLGSR